MKPFTFGKDYFKNRVLVIASKHQKESIIAPILLEALSLKETVVSSIDTDKFGTFSGETERTVSPIEALRLKCREALENTEYDLAIASEGSFGAHPSYPFIHADDELVLLWDKTNDLEIWAREVSPQTNFNAREIYSLEEAMDFAKEAKFPSHHLIVKDKKDKPTFLQKGIDSFDKLSSIATELLKLEGQFYIETDMRACYNPTRMQVIAVATQKLLEKLQSLCPNCQCPGFGLTQTKKGLRCEQCHTPTNLPLVAIHTCQKCAHVSEVMYPLNIKVADPMYCDICNP